MNHNPVIIAIRDHDIEGLRKAIEKGYNIHLSGMEALESPLHLACKTNFEAAVQELLAHGADPNSTARYVASPLHNAVIHGNLSIISKLILAGANINIADRVGASPLHMASKHGNSENTIRFLLDNDADIDSLDINGNTALHYACQNQQADFITILLEYGAKIDAKNFCGETPLHIASSYATNRVFSLIRHNANVAFQTETGYTPLHCACDSLQKNSKEIVAELLRAKSDINALTNDKKTPLHIACSNGSSHIIHVLLEHGALVNLQDVYGFTPLHNACSHFTKVDIILDLVEAGADLSIANKRGHLPVDITPHKEIRDLIRSLDGGKPTKSAITNE